MATLNQYERRITAIENSVVDNCAAAWAVLVGNMTAIIEWVSNNGTIEQRAKCEQWLRSERHSLDELADAVYIPEFLTSALIGAAEAFAKFPERIRAMMLGRRARSIG